jgi:hypothetical protein
MCFITNKINNVSNIQSLVHINDLSEQLTIYSACIDNSYDNNYMILPVPNSETVDFLNIDVSIINQLTQDNFFNNTEKSIFSNIEIFKSYNELLLFFKKIFIVNKCYQELKNYSSKIWGFIVCKLNIGNYQYMPLCYKHKMIVSHSYIPTKKCYMLKSHIIFNNNNYNWDNKIYLLNTSPSIVLLSLSNKNEYYIINSENNIIIDNKYDLGKYIGVDKYLIYNSTNKIICTFNTDLFNYYFIK